MQIRVCLHLSSDIYATTVAIFTKIRIFQFCFLQWVTMDAKRLKKFKSKIGLPKGVLEQLVNCFLEAPKGSLLFRHKMRIFNSLFLQWVTTDEKRLKKVINKYWTS